MATTRWYLFIILLLFLFAHQSNAHADTEPVSIRLVSVIVQEKMVQAFLTNNTDTEQRFLYVMQLKDSNGYTLQIAYVEKTMWPNESLTVEQPFKIEKHDAYTVEVFIWSDLAAPVPLSSNYGSATFNFSMPIIQCKGTALCFEGRVNTVINGDTMDVNGRLVKLALVKTPERGETGYAEAAKFTSSVCSVGSPAFVDQDDKQMFDRNGKIIAVVYCDGALLNSELIINYHAVIVKELCEVSEFGDEDWAKQFGC